MAATINPTTITVTDASASAQQVTSFKILVGTVSGGPYSASAATIPTSSFSASGSNLVCPFSAATFSPALNPDTTYFAVCEAVNAAGSSGNSPEASFFLEPAPSSPTALAFS